MTLWICIGSACHLKGSYEIIGQLEELIKNYHLESKITIKAAFCLGYCTNAVAVKLDEQLYSVDQNHVEEFFHATIREKVKSCD